MSGITGRRTSLTEINNPSMTERAFEYEKEINTKTEGGGKGVCVCVCVSVAD